MQTYFTSPPCSNVQRPETSGRQVAIPQKLALILREDNFVTDHSTRNRLSKLTSSSSRPVPEYAKLRKTLRSCRGPPTVQCCFSAATGAYRFLLRELGLGQAPLNRALHECA